MNVTPHEFDNAQALIREMRQRLEREGAASTKGRAPRDYTTVATQFFKRAQPPPTSTPARPFPPPHKNNGGALSADEIEQARLFFGLTTLDSLSTDHMTKAAAATYMQMLADVRAWRAANVPGQAFVLCSKGSGAGKTHVAKAVMDSFARLFWKGEGPEDRPQFYGGDESVTLERNGVMLTARECMELVGDGEGWQKRLAVRRLQIVVLDDVGREGLLKYVKQDEANQTQLLEKQARYYEFINFCYERRLKLFVTSNLLWEQLEAFFNGATWSRLNEMAPDGCVYELKSIPDYRLLKSNRSLKSK